MEKESIADRMSNIRFDLRNIRKDMQSLSPKLKLYRTLQDKIAYLERELATLGAIRTNV